MSSRQIFTSRLIKGWKYQYGVIRSIADWTIMLYLVIPFTIISVLIYRSWWLETPVWLEHIPLIILYLVIYAFSWSGNIHTLVEEADKVFLIRDRNLYYGMKKWGYAFSLIVQMFASAMLIGLALPFLRNLYHLDWQEISVWLWYFIALKPVILYLKFQLRKIDKRLKKLGAGFLLFILLSWVSQGIFYVWDKGAFPFIYLFGAAAAAVFIFLTLKLLIKISAIEHEIDMGMRDRTKYIELIFTASYDIEKPIYMPKRSKPLLFRKSKVVFRKRTKINGFLELFIKIFIRNYSYIGGYFQMISITSAALVIIPPYWIKAIIFVGFLIMMYSWLVAIWDRITLSNPIHRHYRESISYFSARNRAVRILFVLAIVILAIIMMGWISVMSYFRGYF